MAALRHFRRRFLPFIPSGDTVRLERAKALRRFGSARTREPRLLVERPELRYGSLLPLVVADR